VAIAGDALENETDETPDYRVPIDDPRFLNVVFTESAKKRKAAYSECADTIKRVCADEYDEISRRIDRSHLQDSVSVRNIMRTRRLANLLINDKGDLNLELFPKAIEYLTANLYSLGPRRQNDAPRQEHILRVLSLLLENPSLARLLRTISKPYQHQIADQIIRDTLQLPHNVSVTDAHARRAALSAWMCYLRQNVGSCFATAPAIVVHDEQPDVFLTDLREILNTGRLKRTFGGVEYAVPLSMSWGAGDLKRPILLVQGAKKEAEHLALAPGLLAALQAINMINSKEGLSNKVAAAQKLIEAVLVPMEKSQAYFWTTAEDLIKGIILKELALTVKDLEEYALRPRAMIQESLLMHMPKSTKRTGGKGEACGMFYVMFDGAKNAFKGIADNALLKNWEFTLASFAETKAEFTRWNLYSSLGLSPDQRGGIGAALYEKIKGKLDHYNSIIRQHQDEYEQLYGQLKFLEGRMKNASTEKEINWMRVEYQSRMHEFYMLEELRDAANAKGRLFTNLINDLIKSFDSVFPKYFQEVYDADMRDVVSGPYDDSPAGFRLLYKHGRGNTAQWSLIKTPQEFVDALSSFFVAIEPELRALEGYESISDDISDVVTSVVSHVKTQEFLETAFHRMAVAHHVPMIKDPLKHLDKIEKKPWAYTSGGGMDSLVSCYFCLGQKPTQASRWVENEVELLVFLVDTVKLIPYKILEEYVNQPERSMLMYSPTHAFLLKPGKSPLKEAWQAEKFTYTWIRDELIKPVEFFWENLLLDEEAMQFLIQLLLEKVPANFQPRFKTVFAHPHGKMTPSELKTWIVDTMDHDRGLRYGGHSVLNPDEIDHILFQSLPLTPRNELYRNIDAILALVPEIPPEFKEDLHAQLENYVTAVPSAHWVTALSLQEICKALICIATKSTSQPINYPSLILQAAQQLRLAPPPPIIFGDTNWVRDLFAFVVAPGSGRLELWRVDALGATGYPMTVWKEWLNGSRRDVPWGIYTRPYEYKKQVKLI